MQQQQTKLPRRLRPKFEKKNKNIKSGVLSKSQNLTFLAVSISLIIMILIYLYVMLFTDGAVTRTIAEEPSKKTKSGGLRKGLDVYVEDIIEKYAYQRHDAKNSSPNFHLAVVVRTYLPQRFSLRALIWNLRSQRFELETSDSHQSVDLSFYVVPTEPRNQQMLLDISSEMSLYKGENDVNIINLSDTWYEDGETLKRKSLASCTAKWRQDYLQWATEHEIIKMCDYNNYVHYLATDFAINEIIDNCQTCTHILVTNADNIYDPDFISKTIIDTTMISNDLHAPLPDIIITDFLTNRQPQKAAIELAKLDLGGIIVTKKFIKENGITFINSLPGKGENGLPHPKEVHDADWWYVDNIINRKNGNYKIIHEILFNHN